MDQTFTYDDYGGILQHLHKIVQTLSTIQNIVNGTSSLLFQWNFVEQQQFQEK